MTQPWKCQCRGRTHPGHFECEVLINGLPCSGGHNKVDGKWMRCNHDGTFSPYENPTDRRRVDAAQQARSQFQTTFDARKAAASDTEPVNESPTQRPVDTTPVDALEGAQ